MKEIIVYTDGGSRGNPGFAGVGAVIEYDGEHKQYSSYIGDHKTNNEAEYEALIFALKKTRQLLGKDNVKNCHLKCYADSELMVKQLNHQYKLKDAKVQKYFIEIWNLMMDFGKIEFIHVPREKNKLADSLANKAMDENSSKF